MCHQGHEGQLACALSFPEFFANPKPNDILTQIFRRHELCHNGPMRIDRLLHGLRTRYPAIFSRHGPTPFLFLLHYRLCAVTSPISSTLVSNPSRLLGTISSGRNADSGTFCLTKTLITSFPSFSPMPTPMTL